MLPAVACTVHCRVTWKLGVGSLKVIESGKVPPFDSFGMVSYSTSIATMAIVAEVHRLIGQKLPSRAYSHPPLYLAPLLGVKHAVGVEQRRSVTKNY